MFFASIVLVASAHFVDVSISMSMSSMMVDMPKAENRPSKGTIWGTAMAESATGKRDKDELLPGNYIQHSCHRVIIIATCSLVPITPHNRSKLS
ncbi:hypothetical protein PUN28_005180 [Cardiocondyla obscurior]|uniref:Secreted protein n=1 Tax=Cardiocondyla obscurior TaxID=286306 RepID=A0AAW2GHL7_9HYME